IVESTRVHSTPNSPNSARSLTSFHPLFPPRFLRAVTMKSDQPRLQLRVLNEQNLIIDSLLVGDLIRLEVVSVDYKFSCRLISCITVSQLLLGCMVLLFLDLIVFFLLVWSYRHKLIWRLRPTPKSELQPSGDSRIIPEMSMSSTPQNDLFDSCLIGQPLIGVSGHRSTEGTDMESVRSHLNVCEFYPNSPALTPQSLVVGRAVISL
ncbi:hypothetical protein T265_15505, partial [Opisthorchis viverrini]